MNDSYIPSLIKVDEAKLRTICGEKGNYEASGVVVHDGHFYVVFDSQSQTVQLSADNLHSATGILYDTQIKNVGYEGIAFDAQDETFYIIAEAVKQDDKYYPWIHEYNKQFEYLAKSRLEFAVDNNKGMEGIAFIQVDQASYLLTLCEGNWCLGGDAGSKPGGGRIQVFERDVDKWSFVRTISLPESVTFKDYSGLEVCNRRVLVVSQTSSKLWVSTLEIEDNQWKLEPGQIYEFPKTKNGNVKYCNIEGVGLKDDNTIVAVSDARKPHQPKRCKKKAQSIHIFQIPD